MLIILWLPIVSLALTMLVVGAAFALMFCSVAFAGWSGGIARPSADGDLPALSGEHLRSWAANLARRVVARHARQPRSAETPLAIAIELEAGANAVLEQAARRTHSEVSETCPDTRPRQIVVTAPEVFAIAAELERNTPKSEQQVIRELASLNARRARFIMPDEFPQAGIHCPLRSEDGHCLTILSRPMACQRLCSAYTCAGDGSCTEQLQIGMADGLSEGLRQEGLDGDTYELNDALATALATPDAAVRWSRGEAVFANCAKV